MIALLGFDGCQMLVDITSCRNLQEQLHLVELQQVILYRENTLMHQRKKMNQNLYFLSLVVINFELLLGEL
uniref:Uncharacterized protein n=1 Tax=Anopheles funestus TaxID=62324 RepID=A0A4Y0BJJ3_ANOFN